MKAKLFIFVFGFVVGLAAALLMPRFWSSLVPQGWKGQPVEGVVEAKRWEDERLLLTLVTGEGAVLATFRRQVAEIDLLVTPGDTVSLALGNYRPFVEDPEIARVVKPKPEPPPRPKETSPPALLPPEEPSSPQVEEIPEASAADEPDATADGS